MFVCLIGIRWKALPVNAINYHCLENVNKTSTGEFVRKIHTAS